jgi:hypothetical protein
MSITADSTYIEVALATPVLPNSDDIGAWSDIDLPGVITDY